MSGAERWKVSRYVTRVDLDAVDTMLLYGGLAGRLVELTGSKRLDAEAVLADPNAGRSKASDHEVRGVLEDQGILVPEAWDERALLEERRAMAHDPNVGSMSLTICPTVNCNYRCTYCYQHHVGKWMPDGVQDRLVSFLERQQPAVGSLWVTWFGGEPLLALPVIERLTRLLRALVPEQAYGAHIITNGSLLTPDVSERLVELGVESAQITLDGPRELHDRRRPMASGEPTFDRILRHLREADPRLRFSVRVNTDARNASRVTELFDELDDAGLRGRLVVYFAPVMPYTEVCSDTAGHCLAGQDWSRVNARLRLEAVERGYGSVALPQSRSGVCIADNPRGWVVTPDGLFYKCWNDVTEPDKAVYDVFRDEQTPRMRAELDRWQAWSPFALSDCVDCKTLPQCHSGCAHLAMKQPGPLTHGDCSELKWNLPETIATYYLAQTREQAARNLAARMPRLIPLRQVT
jgi:uncharacterized protein